MTLSLDTLAIVRKLQAAGFPEAQAEAVTTVIRDSRETDLSVLATKADLKAVEAGIAALRKDTKADIDALRLSTKADIADSKAEIIKWVLSAIGFQAIVILGTAIALFKATVK